jgi:class 3 adenylate cyclase/predicted ATPase
VEYLAHEGLLLFAAEDSRMDVAAWLRGLGLEQYEPAFRDNYVDADVLPNLTGEDLVGLGVTAIGHRRKLLSAIGELSAEAPAVASAMTAALDNLPTPAPAPADAERRQLTVMFCDLVGSTALSTRHDPEDLRELIGDYHGAVAETVGRFDGFVAKYMGDGVLIYFGYPQAHENDAEQAVRAGLAVIEAVGRLSAREDLSVRLGVATGLAVVGDLIGEGAAQERGVVGETPNLAARLQALAEPNMLVIGEATRRQIGGLFDMEDLGAQQLAGFGEPQRAWRVMGESGEVSRFEALRSGETPLVGREEDVELLVRRWQQAKSGEGRVVLISGEPGIGKSRLTAALSEHIGSEPHTRLRYFCSPHHQDSALYPLIGQLERASGFARHDGPETKLDKVTTLLAPVAEASDISLLVELLSLPGGDHFAPLELSPQRKKGLTFTALLRQLEALARQQPVLMIFEDLHWIDPTSREFLDLVLERIDRLPVLLVATFRPEFQPPWTGQPHVTVMSLNRLGRGDGAAMVERLTGNAALLPPDVIAEIIERTDGVPLFVEEMTKAVLEAGAERGREIAASAPGAGLGVPATLQASLMARLDRLGLAAKGVAQIGAAIGREFSYELAVSVAELAEERFQDALRRLVDAGLVFQRGAPPTAEYLFKHALVQDTAYGTLLRGPRQALQARIAEAIEHQMPERVEREPEVLAYHLAEAGQPERAAIYWRKAGEQAVRRDANREAIGHFHRALALVEAQPKIAERWRAELAILSQLAPPLMTVHGWSATEVGEVVERAAQIGRQLESSPELAPAIANLWIFNASRGRVDRCEEISADLFRMAGELGDADILLQAHHCAWATRFFQGRLNESAEHVAAGAKLYDVTRHAHHRHLYLGHDPRVCGMNFGASVQAALGYRDRARGLVADGFALARRLEHPPSLGNTLWRACEAFVMLGDVASVSATARELLELADAHGIPVPRAHALHYLGWALAHSGDAVAGLARMDEGMKMLERMGARVHATFVGGLVADALLIAGRYVEGLEQVRRTLEIGAQTGESSYASWLHRIRAELLKHTDGAAGAEIEASLNQAIAIAQQQDAKGWEIGATTDLARLWTEHGRRAEARDLLAPVYGWFTEGFETADLKAAKVLLDELA